MATTTTASTGATRTHAEPGDDNGGIVGVPGADDTATDDHGIAMQAEPGDDKGVAPGADDPTGDNRGVAMAQAEPGDDKGAAAGADDPAGHHHFSFTNTSTHSSGSDDGAVYTGPVTGLQQEYGWTGHDGRAVSANVPSAFIHGATAMTRSPPRAATTCSTAARAPTSSSARTETTAAMTCSSSICATAR